MKALGGRARRAPLIVAAALLVAVGTAGCGDGGGGDGERSTPTGVATTGGGTGAPEGSATPGGNGPADPAAAERQVRENWEKFFDPSLSNDQKAKYLQNGEDLKLLLEAFNGDKRGGQVASRVTKVTFTSPTEGDVTYTLTLNGTTALPNAKGVTVLQNGVWKVSLKTLCGLVNMSDNGVKVPGC
ncbi:hypothetical protein [Streptomyces sp. NPDC003077]|uniref:hypothetical protein n=1 Tax=Streptomyces sp. NPDC003077 TaxID=3154443 RepID=UPI0033B55C12